MDRFLKIICCLIIISLMVFSLTTQKPTIVTDKYEQTISQYSITDNGTNMTIRHYHFLNTTKGEVMVDKWTYDNTVIGDEVNL